MSKLPQDLQHMTDELPPANRAEIEEAIPSSPLLLSRLAREADAGRLEHIRMQQGGEHSGGYFDKDAKAIYLNPDVFTKFKEKDVRLDRITYVLGHEVGHSTMASSREHALRALNSAADQAFLPDTSGTTVDLTAAAEITCAGRARTNRWRRSAPSTPWPTGWTGKMPGLCRGRTYSNALKKSAAA